MQPSTGDGRSLRVLVVDPDDRTRESLSGLLGIGRRCVVLGGAGRADDALRLAADLRPDVVILDARLPDVDGAAQFAEKVRDLLPGVRIVVMRRSDGGDGEQPSIAADGFVRKTFRAHELVDAVLAVADAAGMVGCDGPSGVDRSLPC
jgi:DNA-binding NarL/FixJ family response regulator